MESFGKNWESGHISRRDGKHKMLTLHNDDINSFDYVIEVLCEICDHDGIQAEQCAFLTHFVGYCQIKIGSVEELIPLRKRLMNKNLLVTLD